LEFFTAVKIQVHSLATLYGVKPRRLRYEQLGLTCFRLFITVLYTNWTKQTHVVSEIPELISIKCIPEDLQETLLGELSITTILYKAQIKLYIFDRKLNMTHNSGM